MATLEKLRNRAGVLVAVVIGLALVAFILGDLLSSGGSLFNRSQLEIAEIAGTSVSYQQYQAKVDELVEINKMFSGENSVDQQTSERIREQVWQEFVRDLVLVDEYEKLGITIHPNELFDMVQGKNIHPIIRQLFANPQTGEVDPAQVIQFLKNMELDQTGRQRAYWMFVEREISVERLFTKYNNLIRKGMYVTKLQTESALADRNTTVDFNFVNVPYTSIPDSTVKIAKSDLEKYYKENLSDYEQKASRDVAYVVFPVVASESDNKMAEEWVNKIAPEFAAATDARQFVNLNSDTPFDGKNHKKGELPQSIDAWAFDAKVGDTYGPFFEDNAYKIARIAEVSFLSDSVKARHILLGVMEQSQEAYNKAKTLADSLVGVIRKGGNFAGLAKEYSNDPGSADKGGDLGWFAEGVMVKPFNDACFSGKKGDIAVVESQFGFHIIQILDKGKESKKVQVAMLERKVIPSTQTYQRIYSQASQFAGLNTSTEMFEKAAEEQSLTKRIANNLLEADSRIAGLDNPRELVRWAFKAELNNVSSVFEFGDNFVVATLTDVREEGSAPLEKVKNDVMVMAIREKKAEMLSKKVAEALKSATTIEQLGQELNVQVNQAAGISFSSFSLPNYGPEPVVIASAVSAPEAKLAGPIKGNSGVYALVVSAKNVQEGVDIDSEKQRLTNSYQSRAFYEAYEALKKASNIKDMRSKFF
ncbi:MAG: SurA N-terminal domain-containing protein [Bacteroidales bacterium]|nr:SurA N-terminal domain-containing protein [Bacteroidales bacterium]MBN2748140.1 SurA N-terminal domain-containing protein [Bacteroidales bacterium]